EAPDPTMTRVALEHGIDLRDLRSRQLTEKDFYNFDLLVAMDRANEADILALRPGDSQAEVVRFMSFVPDTDADDVPDPWWAGRIEGFEEVCSLVQGGIPPLLDHILTRQPQ
ncbi:MAG: low molecular weight phosphotyrosine protein phosphatase, partial [Myxococcota bacterium]|nr:low molecular weight phosphotyrosine protein phosphatase [Myxococcota bacterium]